MSDKTVTERLKEIICEQLGVDESQVTPEALFDEDLGADSLDGVELVMAIEEEWSIEIPDDESESIKTVADAVKLIEGKIA